MLELKFQIRRISDFVFSKYGDLGPFFSRKKKTFNESGIVVFVLSLWCKKIATKRNTQVIQYLVKCSSPIWALKWILFAIGPILYSPLLFFKT